MDRESRRILFVADAPPVQSSGTNIVLRRLLENFDPQDLVVLARKPRASQRLAADGLPYPVVTIPSRPPGGRGERYWNILAALTGLSAGLMAIARHSPVAILGMFPDESSLLLAYSLSRRTGLPLLVYFCDLYLEDRSRGWQAALARYLQPRVFDHASRVCVVNDGMAAFYRDRYGIEPIVLPACINVPVPGPGPPPQVSGPVVIGYSGNVNDTRLGSLRALTSALSAEEGWVLRYFTPQSPQLLEKYGVWPPGATAEFVGMEAELVNRLADCDILFLPLSFDPGHHSRDQMATSFGIKSYEYFLSRRPILLHAPGDTFIARFYREHDCGLVVDDPSPRALLEGLRRLRDDSALRERLVANALHAARRFAGSVVAERLRDAVRQCVDKQKGRSA